MTAVAYGLLAWTAASVIAAPIVGRLLRFDAGR